MRENVVRRAVHEQIAGVHDHDALHIAGDVVHAVGDENDRHPALAVHAGDHAEDLIPSHRIKSRRGFVENHDFRAHGEYTGDGDAAFLAAGQLERRSLVVLLSDFHLPERLHSARGLLLVRETQVLRAEFHIGQNIRLKQLMLRVLEDKADLGAELPSRVAIRPDILSVIPHRSGAWLQQAVEQLHKGGFSGSCVSDEADELTVRNPCGQAVKRP